MAKKLVTKEQFLSDVMTEINSLKEIATPEEIGRLNFKNLNPREPNSCIYGQMTGSCESERAKVLMDQACVRVMNCNYNGKFVTCNIDENFESIQKYINGENEGQGWSSDGDRDYDHLSMVEAYIMLRKAKNTQIIQYLKGEIDTLVL